jgi:hypothetical protein
MSFSLEDRIRLLTDRAIAAKTHGELDAIGVRKRQQNGSLARNPVAGWHAFELYVKRSMVPGPLEDWLQAEAELVLGHSTSDSN